MTKGQLKLFSNNGPDHYLAEYIIYFNDVLL